MRSTQAARCKTKKVTSNVVKPGTNTGEDFARKLFSMFTDGLGQLESTPAPHMAPRHIESENSGV